MEGACQKFTIYRVPIYIRESNHTAYEPRLVSIAHRPLIP